MSSLSSVFPSAPAYYKHFTKENLEKLKELQAKDDYSEDKLEPPLSYLVPPKPVTDKPYRSFGNVWQPDDSLDSLESMGVKQLYGEITTPSDRVSELKKLVKSLLLNYLELVGIMSSNPEKYVAKMEHIHLILINIHHLLNEYRPHQSRENLITLMESQIKTKKEQIDMLRTKNTEIFDKIKEMAKTFDLKPQTDTSLITKHTNSEEKKDQEHKEHDLAMWKILDTKLN